MPEISRPHDVTGLTAGELDRARRELQASLALARPDSPARGPILAYLNAINAELAERAGQCPTTGPLADLRWHWGGAYLISGIIGCWRAERRDDGRTLTADDPEKLRRAMIADYTAKPVPNLEAGYPARELTATGALGRTGTIPRQESLVPTVLPGVLFFCSPIITPGYHRFL